MGRGRAKAKQTKVARDLKYRTHETDFGALARELHGDPGDPDPVETTRSTTGRTTPNPSATDDIVDDDRPPGCCRRGRSLCPARRGSRCLPSADVKHLGRDTRRGCPTWLNVPTDRWKPPVKTGRVSTPGSGSPVSHRRATGLLQKLGTRETSPRVRCGIWGPHRRQSRAGRFLSAQPRQVATRPSHVVHPRLPGHAHAGEDAAPRSEARAAGRRRRGPARGPPRTDPTTAPTTSGAVHRSRTPLSTSPSATSPSSSGRSDTGSSTSTRSSVGTVASARPGPR